MKTDHGIDLCSQDTGPMIEFGLNPLFVTEACYGLFIEQLEAAKIDEDAFADLLGPDEIAALQTEVTQQMGSFSRLWRMFSTEMDKLLSGDTNLQEMAKMVAESKGVPEASGLSS